METADGGELTPGACQPTYIDMHIHQEPLLNLSSLLRASAPSTTSQSPGCRSLLVSSWVVQIVLGLLSAVLGGFCCLFYWDSYFLSVYTAGTWTGVVAVLAGAVVFIYEKRGGTFWALLRTLLALAAFGTAIAAIYTGAYYWIYSSYSLWEELCGISESWGLTKEANRQRLCLSYQHMLTNLTQGLHAILLSVWVLLLLASLVPLFLYCWRRLQPKEEKDQKSLLGVSKI